MQPVLAAELGHQTDRLARDQRRGSDFAALDLFDGFDLRHADFLGLDS